YENRDSKVFVQCFDAAELRRVRHELGCELPLMQLVGPEPEYAALLTRAGLGEVAGYANGLGPHYSQLAATVDGERVVQPLTRDARDAGLLLHPYTFRADDLPAHEKSIDDLLEFFLAGVGVDGVFCDHPD